MRYLSFYILSLFAVFSVNGRELFRESFEPPENTNVTGLTKIVPNSWTGSNAGYEAGKRGLADEDSAYFSTPFGSQAFHTNFPSNAGAITNPNVIGEVVAGATYTLSFNVAVARDHPEGSGGFLVQLRVMDETTNRHDIRDIDGRLGTLLLAIGSKDVGREAIQGVAKGKILDNVTSSDMSAQFSHSFTAEAGSHYIGKDMAIVIIGRERHGSGTFYDNIVVKDDIPEPAALGLIAGSHALVSLRRRRR